ncbi:MlaD family protein [Flavobacterium sp.]|uniref:MlaD family protein n=1 Tax=Flavobacterium sp. TaxID=239 RepID=UPI00286E883A|nr:MlaD family protein [Flavobacterium sp.]
MKITREIKTAVLVIASILLFIWGYSFLKGQNLFNSHKKLFVEFENIEGLAASAPVTISGKSIGKVNAITLNKNGMLLIELQINEDNFPISKTSIAQIYEPGFIGGKQIAIIPNYKDTEMTVTGDMLLSDIKLGLMSTVGEKLVPTQQKIDKLIVDADGLVSNMNDVLDAQTKQNLKNSIAQLNQTLTEINKATQKVNEMLASNQQKINNSLSNVEKVSENFVKISSDLENANLGQTIKTLEGTLDNVNKIMANLESGKGTMGKMLKDDAMYNNLTKTSKELELLLQDVRLHPTRYVNVSLFGKKEKPYTEPQPKN